MAQHRPRTKSSLFCAFIFGSSCLPLTAFAWQDHHYVDSRPREQAPDITSAITNGDLGIQMRLRAESAEDHHRSTSSALTMRSQLGYDTAEYMGFSAALELNATMAISEGRFNSGRGTTPAKASRTVIPDPKGAGITQMVVRYSGYPDNEFRVGRQYIAFDNQRMVGGDDFRQHPQTYDAFMVVNNTLPATISYAYIDQLNGAYAGSQLALNRVAKHSSHLLHATMKHQPWGNGSAYAYYIQDHDTKTHNNFTIGVRYTGEKRVEDLDISGVAEYAFQNDAADNPHHYRSDYYTVQVTVASAPFRARVGYEVLSGSASHPHSGFQTPLADLHEFQGWADVFEHTPDLGVKNLFISADTTFRGVELEATYHHLRSDRSDTRYGYEWDLAVKKHICDNYYVEAMYADFRPNTASGFADASKFWLTAGLVF